MYNRSSCFAPHGWSFEPQAYIPNSWASEGLLTFIFSQQREAAGEVFRVEHPLRRVRGRSGRLLRAVPGSRRVVTGLLGKRCLQRSQHLAACEASRRQVRRAEHHVELRRRV